MPLHIRSGFTTVVHSFSPFLMLSFNTSKYMSLSNSVNHSDITSELNYITPSIGTLLVPSIIPSMDH